MEGAEGSGQEEEGESDEEYEGPAAAAAAPAAAAAAANAAPAAAAAAAAPAAAAGRRVRQPVGWGCKRLGHQLRRGLLGANRAANTNTATAGSRQLAARC